MENTDLLTTIQTALGSHGEWKTRLMSSIATGKADIPPTIASCDDRCDFGRWLYSPDVGPNIRTSVSYQVIRRLHADFHKSAGQVIRCAIDGNREKASSIMETDFAEKAQKLDRGLNKWMTDLK